MKQKLYSQNRTWANAVAFQPVSTRFETGRWDSPVEGFAFRLWQWDEAEAKDTFTVGRERISVDEIERYEIFFTILSFMK